MNKDEDVVMEVFVMSPTHPKAERLTQADVWGSTIDGVRTRGMIVARSGETCPHFEDEVPHKSVTVVCDVADFSEVAYWLEYVQGSNCITAKREIKNDNGVAQLALRADYMCW